MLSHPRGLRGAAAAPEWAAPGRALRAAGWLAAKRRGEGFSGRSPAGMWGCREGAAPPPRIEVVLYWPCGAHLRAGTAGFVHATVCMYV